MKVKIENNIYLESDERQFILREYAGKTYTNKKGEEIESSTVIGYYPSVKMAVDSLVKKKLLESNATTLKELSEEVENIGQFIREKLSF